MNSNDPAGSILEGWLDVLVVVVGVGVVVALVGAVVIGVLLGQRDRRRRAREDQL